MFSRFYNRAIRAKVWIKKRKQVLSKKAHTHTHPCLFGKSFVQNFATFCTSSMHEHVCVCMLSVLSGLIVGTHIYLSILSILAVGTSYTRLRVCAQQESCIRYIAGELCGKILNLKNFHQNRSAFSVETRHEFIRVAEKLRAWNIKQCVFAWIEHHDIWLRVFIFINIQNYIYIIFTIVRVDSYVECEKFASLNVYDIHVIIIEATALRSHTHTHTLLTPSKHQKWNAFWFRFLSIIGCCDRCQNDGNWFWCHFGKSWLSLSIVFR